MDTGQSIQYPKAVFYVLATLAFERYSYFGITCILPLYLRNALQYMEEDAVMIYHVFTSVCLILPIFGGILADSYIGMYQTIVFSSAVATVGHVILALSAIPWFLSPRVLAAFGLLLTAIGGGLMKPCMSAFGGQQFVLRQQAKQLATYFSIFYFTVNVAGLATCIIGPVLRQDFKCLGQQTCYLLAFTVPAFLMFPAFVSFICGKPLYKMSKPTSNILADVLKLVYYSLREKLSSKKTEKKPSHWLEYGRKKFGPQLVKDVQAVLKVLVMFLPVPVFYAVNAQQCSSWIFQMSKMDGIVEGWFTIKPEQMGAVNPVLCVLLVPVYEFFVYPMLAKIGIKRPLQFIIIGAFLNGAAFVMSAYVEYTLEPFDAKLPNSGLGHLRIFNGLPCQVELTPPIQERFVIPPLGALQWTDIPLKGNLSKEERLILNNGLACKNIQASVNWTSEILLLEEKSTSYVVSVREGIADLYKVPGFDDVRKSESNAPRLRVIHNLDGPLLLKNQFGSEHFFHLQASDLVTSLREIYSGSYQIMYANETVLSNLEMRSGGVYTLVLQQVDSKIVGNLHTITPPAPLHILWILPQLTVMTFAELFFVLTFMSFIFTQVPDSMRSIMMSVFLLSTSLGNILVVFVTEMKFFHRQTHEYLFYSGLMFLDTILLIALSIRYKYKDTLSNGNTKIPSKLGPEVKTIFEGTEANGGTGGREAQLKVSTIGGDNTVVKI